MTSVGRFAAGAAIGVTATAGFAVGVLGLASVRIGSVLALGYVLAAILVAYWLAEVVVPALFDLYERLR